MKPAEYTEFMTTKVADASSRRGRSDRLARSPGDKGRRWWRRTGAPCMPMGPPKCMAPPTPDFRGIEGYEDHGLDVLFFWDLQDHLIATVINVPCPAQEAEGGLALHADFWHPVRERLRQQHGKDLLVLGWAGAGGDQTSRPMYRKAAEERMRKLRGLTGLEEVARRIVDGWEDA